MYKQLLASIFIFLLAYIVGDNLLFSYSKSKVKEQQLSVSFRHVANTDSLSSPSAGYISISNNTLNQASQRFRTGHYGEGLSSALEPAFYEYECKLVFLGGSSTESRWVTEKGRWVSLLQKQLVASKIKAAVFNFGVGGQNLSQTLLRYSAYIAGLEPRKVFLMHEANDISKFLKGGYEVREGSLHNLYDRDSVANPLSRRVIAISRLTLPFTSEILRESRNKYYSRPPPRLGRAEFSGLLADKAAEHYAGRVLALSAIVSSYGGELIFIEYPEVYKDVLGSKSVKANASVKAELVKRLALNGLSSEDFLTYVENFRSNVRTILLDSNITIIERPDYLTESHFYDSIHFNDEGSKLFSDWLWPKIKDNACA
jgi:lysophospholipase L1-like esterase